MGWADGLVGRYRRRGVPEAHFHLSDGLLLESPGLEFVEGRTPGHRTQPSLAFEHLAEEV